MTGFSFILHFSARRSFLFVREMNGHDEMLVNEINSACAIQLIRNLTTSIDSNSMIAAEDIAVSDRDFLLGQIYRHTFGSRVESTLKCVRCSKFFDVGFSLDDLERHVLDQRVNLEMTEDGYYASPAQQPFRLPTGADELAVRGLPATMATNKLLERCLRPPQVSFDVDAIQDAMEQVGPLLSLTMNVSCAECGEVQPVHFDMQSFLLQRLKNEQKKLAVEVHCLAKMYKWGYQEILGLPRSFRQMYAKLTGLN